MSMKKTAVFGAAACKCRLRYSDSDKVCLFCSRDGRNEISDFFTAVVQYVKGNVTYTKTAYLGFAGENADELLKEENTCKSNDVCGACGETGECSQGCGGSCCK